MRDYACCCLLPSCVPRAVQCCNGWVLTRCCGIHASHTQCPPSCLTRSGPHAAAGAMHLHGHRIALHPCRSRKTATRRTPNHLSPSTHLDPIVAQGCVTHKAVRAWCLVSEGMSDVIQTGEMLSSLLRGAINRESCYCVLPKSTHCCSPLSCILGPSVMAWAWPVGTDK